MRTTLALAAALCAAPIALSDLSAERGAAAESGAALERALDAIRTASIEADLHFVASDELGGRDTPSPGLRVAARFIRARLQRIGFQPGAENGYFHEYPLNNTQVDGEGTHILIERGDETQRLAFATDYALYARGLRDGVVSGPVAFAGSGEREELAELSLEGKWALCFDPGQGSNRRRIREVQKTGAVGVLLTPGPDYDGKPYGEKFGGYAARQLRPRVSYPSSRSSDDDDAAPFSVVYLPRASTAGLLAGVHDGAKLGADLGVNLTETRAMAGSGGQVLVENVCGYWPGSDPVLKNEVIVLSAHYDHVGMRPETGEIYNGADDNGSGSVGLLAIAEALAQYGPMRRSVLILWVSGEEKGLWGSRAWTEDPWLPEGARAVCNLNIDMIGRNAPDSLLITPTSSHDEYNGLTKLAEKVAPLEGFGPLGDADEYWHRSDHANFASNLKIPVAFLFSDIHEDYHQPGDTADKVDCDKVRRVSRVILRMLDGLQTDRLEL